MTRMARTLIIGPVVGIGLGLWATMGAAVPVEATRVSVNPTAAHRPVSGDAKVLTPPALTDVVAPLVLAALCGTAAALFSAGPRRGARARLPGRHGRG